MISIETLEYFIRTYGYWTLLFGTFIEGETILLLGGVSAQMGYLDIRWVIVIAFIGSFSGDQVYFHIGRWKGQELLARYPKWQAKAHRVYHYLERYHDLIMIGFRFVYGIRILTPIVLAMNPKIKTSRFVVFNAIGAMIWSIVVAGGGYLFGGAIQIVLKNIKDFEIVFFCGTALIVTVVFLYRRHQKKKFEEEEKNCPYKD
jgi:membrane protein DedA with SNARE-associated domain